MEASWQASPKQAVGPIQNHSNGIHNAFKTHSGTPRESFGHHPGRGPFKNHSRLIQNSFGDHSGICWASTGHRCGTVRAS
eukprot:1118153-Alexandrium_andersonii.AAC.1